MYGFSSASPTDTFDANDTFIWTTGNRNEVVRAANAPSFFASSVATCEYTLTEGGCINSNASTFNYGMAIAGLHDLHGVHLPLQLNITGWADGTTGDKEPRDGDVIGAYTLNLTRAGPFQEGEAYKIFRFTMLRRRQIDDVITSGRVLGNLTSADAVEELCVSARDACRSHAVRVVEPGPQVLLEAEEHLGYIHANSVVFFVAVRLPVDNTTSSSPSSVGGDEEVSLG